MSIPTVDLSPFFTDADEVGQKKAKDVIKQACSEFGFFQIVNHGAPLDLMTRAVQLSQSFFPFSDEEKTGAARGLALPLPAGYSKQPDHSADKNEYLMMFQPRSGFNMLPSNPPGKLEEMFEHLRETGEVMARIVNDCLGLPPGFFKEYNPDRSWDFMVALRCFPATETGNTGLAEHEDGNSITFVSQDEVGGLEVKRDGKWIPVVPAEGNIIVNIGDDVQVLSNKKFKSATHGVVRSKERSRHSFAFFYTVEGNKWIEPLPEFTEEIGEALYKDYQEMRMRNKSHPPSRPEDVITISHYAILHDEILTICLFGS